MPEQVSTVEFPPVDAARPDGLLAVGGDLSTNTLLKAYSLGIFPWFNEGQPILWWSPDPRMVLYPNQIRISRSLRKSINNKGYQVSFNKDFSSVIRACATARAEEEGTWISSQMIDAYQRLHHLGFAHSVEVSDDHGQKVGGLYGIALNGVFFGESMFHRARDASKVALVALCDLLQRAHFQVIDCQVRTEHLASLGAVEIPRSQFCTMLGASGLNANLSDFWIQETPGPD